jgi:hypothetical protein
VFPAERGGPIRRSNFTRRVWIPATRAAGVEGLRFHDLRHTAATLAVAAGASTRELMVRMDHSSSAAALRYQHVTAGRDAAIAAALDELVQAASARSEGTVAGRSGTRVARTGSLAGRASADDRSGVAVSCWDGSVGRPGLEPGTSSPSAKCREPLC